MTNPYPTEVSEWPCVTLIATCRTRGCPAEGVPFEGVYFENLEPPLYRGQCGQCGQVSDLRTPMGAPA